MQFEKKHVRIVGFVVDCGYYGQVFYVGHGQLMVSPTSVMLQDGYVEQGAEWYEDKHFLWGEPKTTSLIKKFDYRVNVQEVTEVPEWVGKTYEDVQKELKAYQEEVWKRGWFYKLTHCLAKKEK